MRAMDSFQTSSKLPAELRGALESSRVDMSKLYGRLRGLIQEADEDSQIWRDLHGVKNDLLVLMAGQNKSIELVKVCQNVGLVQPMQVSVETLELHPRNYPDRRMMAAGDHSLD